jgi:hypothetical protein
MDFAKWLFSNSGEISEKNIFKNAEMCTNLIANVQKPDF